MSRYIISHRRAGKFGADAQRASRATLDRAVDRRLRGYCDFVSDFAPQAEEERRLLFVTGDPMDLARIAGELSKDVLIEPEAWRAPLSTRPYFWSRFHQAIGPSADAGSVRWSPWLGRGGSAVPPPPPPPPPFPDTGPWSNHFLVPGPIPGVPPWGAVGSLPDTRGTLSRPIDGANTGTGRHLEVTVNGAGGPVPHASLTLALRAFGMGRAVLEAKSDAAGRVHFEFGPDWEPSVLFVDPHSGYWPKILRGPTSPLVCQLDPLPSGSPPWWTAMTQTSGHTDLRRGEGIRIGIADTGLGKHPDLAHVKAVGAFLEGRHLPDATEDVDRHGTHVAGIIASKPNGASGSEYMGAAPGAEVMMARVFPANQGANQGDVANAIDYMSKAGRADLINLSLGGPVPSEIERDAIIDALERGTLCICAAGNNGGPRPGFPAAFPETVAVAALGLEGWGALGSPTAANYPNESEKFGRDQLFLAEFSDFGGEIDCCAPGNGIISTVPPMAGAPAPYAVMDGTSMASPLAAGLLAVLLSRDSAYRALPRNLNRSLKARDILRRGSRDLALHSFFQGAGMLVA